MSDNTVILKTFLYRHEAVQVQEMLESAGIHTVIKGDDAAGWAPFSGIAEGGVGLMIEESKVEEAQKLIADLEK